jgi:hypothetical protein
MSAADLPEWALTLPGFDPSRKHWDPIVCTGGNEGHRITLLGIAYQHDEWSTLHVASPQGNIGTSQRVDRDGTPNGKIHPQLGVREAGSVPITCPECGRTRRIPLVEWADKIAKLADRDRGANGLPPYLDVGLM